jgi:hypothetical protein
MQTPRWGLLEDGIVDHRKCMLQDMGNNQKFDVILINILSDRNRIKRGYTEAISYEGVSCRWVAQDKIQDDSVDDYKKV